MRYVLIVSVWQPRPGGWYEQFVEFFLAGQQGIYPYRVHGAGYGPYIDHWAAARIHEQ